MESLKVFINEDKTMLSLMVGDKTHEPVKIEENLSLQENIDKLQNNIWQNQENGK